LVELLVVIGIIAVLIGMLLPVLAKARAQANTAKCSSNLRSIGQGIQMYAAEQKGFLLPGYVANNNSGGPGLENYATLLVGLKYLPAPATDTVQSKNDSWDNGVSVFNCPEGLPNQHDTAASGWPSDALDASIPQNAIGSFCWRRQSVDESTGTASIKWLNSGVVVDTWYGINCMNTVINASMDNAPVNFPFQKLKIDSTGVLTGKLQRLSSIKNGADLTIMYDGLRLLDNGGDNPGDRNHVSFRHNGGKSANFLFADGHCETLPKSFLPNLTDAQITNKNNGVANLQPWPHPHWRLDQR
jgi:prepilin-type processing-associated H-X9-DG protein